MLFAKEPHSAKYRKGDADNDNWDEVEIFGKTADAKTFARENHYLEDHVKQDGNDCYYQTGDEKGWRACLIGHRPH